MIVREMIDYIQTTIQSRRYWNDDRLISIINMIQLRLSADMKLTVQDLYKFSSSLEQRYLMPSTLLSIELLYYDNGGTESTIKVLPTPKSIFGVFDNPDTETTDNPYRAFIWNTSGRKELWVYPKFATEGIDIWMFFWGTPSKLISDNDVSPFPSDWHVYMVDMCVNKVKQIDEAISISEERGLWNEMLASIKRLETTKGVIERGSILMPSIVGAGDGWMLADGSANGIDWG
jgi:hypothetical protein